MSEEKGLEKNSGMIVARASAYLQVLANKSEVEIEELAKAQAHLDQVHILTNKDWDFFDAQDPVAMAARQTAQYVDAMNLFIKVGYQIPANVQTGELIRESVKEYKTDPEGAKDKIAFAKAVAEATRTINSISTQMNVPVVNVNLDNRRQMTGQERAEHLKNRLARNV